MSRPVILGVPTILQQDFTFLRNLTKASNNTEVRRPQPNPAQNKLILLVAVRIFAVIAAVCFIVRGIRAKAIIGTVVGLLACHEAFVLAHNGTKVLGAESRIMGVMLGVLQGGNPLDALEAMQDTVSELSGEAGENMRRLFEGDIENVRELSVGDQPLAKGTIISPLWGWLAAQYNKHQVESQLRQMGLQQP